MGIISISETDSLLQLEELQFKQTCLDILSINIYHINTNANITNQSVGYSDSSKFADSVEVFHSAYVFLPLLGWVSGTKLCSVSRKISGGFKSL